MENSKKKISTKTECNNCVLAEILRFAIDLNKSINAHVKMKDKFPINLLDTSTQLN